MSSRMDDSQSNERGRPKMMLMDVDQSSEHGWEDVQLI